MINTVFSALARLFGTLLQGSRPASVLVDSKQVAAPNTATKRTRPILHTDASSFARWVDEMDEEVTEYISGQRLSQILLQSEKKSAAVKKRQTARRRQEMLMRPLPARS